MARAVVATQITQRQILPIRKTEMPAELQDLPHQNKHARGVRSCGEGRLREAAMLLGEALGESETCERWNDWATVQTALRNIANAEIGFRRALQIEPENADARTNLGILLARMNRAAEALALLQGTEPPADPQAAQVLASVLVRCRGNAGSETLAGSPADERLSERISRAVERQTSALGTVLLRVAALESRLGIDSPPSLSAGSSTRLKIPAVSAHTILAGTTPLDLLALNATEENVSLHELCLLAALARAESPANIFEIGTADGRTTLNLAANCGESGRVWTLNIPRPELGARFAASPLRHKITQLVGDSAQFDFSPYAGAADLVFIDANHDYDYVLGDSRAALGLLRNGCGTVVWHDYISHWPGVVEALDHLFATESAWSNMRHIESTSLVFANVSPAKPSEEQGA
jgi:predicted O-methyltransferase YrrM